MAVADGVGVGVALGDGDADKGVLVSRESFGRDLVVVYFICMHACIQPSALTYARSRGTTTQQHRNNIEFDSTIERDHLLRGRLCRSIAAFWCRVKSALCARACAVIRTISYGDLVPNQLQVLIPSKQL